MRSIATLATLATATALALAVLPTARVDAQSWGDRLKKKAEEAAKRKVEERTEKRAGQAADKALDKAECAATDKACQEKAAASGGVTPAGAAGGGGSASLKPGEGAWANYDFVPGSRPIFVDDFSKDNVGDFPRRLELKSGNLEVVEWQGGRYLRTTQGSFHIPLPEVLPERFTIEFDYAGPEGSTVSLTFDETVRRNYVVFGAYESGVKGGAVESATPLRSVGSGLFRARVMVDGNHAKVYVNEQRVANVPNASFGRSSRILVTMPRWSDTEPRLIANVRVAAGGTKLYDVLSEKGRVATQGIYFDTGSDRLRPESTPTLKEIAQMLAEHADLRLTIEGHTDNVGDAKANRELSQRRAAAVTAYLVEKHGIAASRLANAGFGDTKPAAPNTTPEGRQQNRRVELVKL
jgi:outer membrane protein OmpA-like peptidoglycan-associated protein